MRHLAFCALVLCGGCGDRRPPKPVVIPGYDPVHDQSMWALYRIARGPAGPADLFVRIERGGRLEIKQRDRWRGATLRELSAYLDRSRRTFADKQQEFGRRGHEVDENGIERGASRQVIEIGLQPEAPWLHLSWLIAICIEEKFDKLQIRLGGRTMFLFLPWDAAIEDYNRPHVYATVKLAADHRYRIEGTEETDLAGVLRYLERRRRSAERVKKSDVLVGALTVPEATLANGLLDVFDAFLDSRIPRLDIKGLKLPSRQTRQLEVLPRPDR